MHLLLGILLTANGLVFGRENEATAPLAGNQNIIIPACAADCLSSEKIGGHSFERDENSSQPPFTADAENVTLSKIVYIVMRRSLQGEWRPMIQSTAFQKNTTDDSASVIYRVIVVDPMGLPRVYGSSESDDIGKGLMGGVRSSLYNRTYFERPSKVTSEWSIKVEKLVRQKVLVLIKIRWEPRALLGLYLVTWEVDGGGIKGNLFTTSNHVTLSLWPDTVYHIQSELISSNIPIKNDKSSIISIDTGKLINSSDDIDNPNNVNETDDDDDEFFAVIVEPFREKDFSVEERTAVYSMLAFLVIFIISLGVARSRYFKSRKNVNLNVDHPYKAVIFTVDKV